MGGWRRAVGVIAGVAAVGVGIVLTLRPFTSLDLLRWFVAASLILAGCGGLLGSGGRRSGIVPRIAGGTLLATGVVAAVLPGLTVSGIAVVVGVGILVSGAARLADRSRRQGDERYPSLVGGLAGVVFGLLALTWPDVTVLVVALLVGPVAIIYGAREAVGALRAPKQEQAWRSGARIWLHRVRGTVALLLALILLLASALIHRASPAVASFYSYSASLPGRPGVLLREEPITEGMPPGSRALRILYTTTGIGGGITPASGIVVVGTGAPAGPRPVLLWEHGTTGVAQKCAPSLLRDPFTAGAMFVQDQVLDRGWALIAPDYLGLGVSPPHPYLVGIPEARSALDAVRAARQLNSIKLRDKTVVWGHSQGGGAALWTAIEAPRYAPDVPLSGVAALAPAADLPLLAKGLETSRVGMLFAAFVVAGYSNAYPDVGFNDYVRSSARTVVRAVLGRCLSEPATLLSLPAVLSGESIFSRDLMSGPLASHLGQNVPSQATKTPTLIAQGEADRLILPSVQSEFARELCKAGEKVEYRSYPGLDHVPLVEPGSALIPYLISWTENRFGAAPAPNNCSTLTHRDSESRTH